jgi:CRISPR-associated protein Csb1
MPDLLTPLTTAPRVLIEAPLRPVIGTRIQPTGFPDLGPALYEAPGENGSTVPTLLVESPQSMANWLEAVCWDKAKDDVVPELKGLPFVRVKLAGLGGGNDVTTSLQEFHRLNSPYIMQKPKDSTRTYTSDGKWFRDVFRGELGLSDRAEDSETGAEGEGGDVEGVVNLHRLALVCFKYDPNSLIHGVFLEKIAGRLRHPRALSAFIEATGVARADSGGVKFDRALPKPKIKKLDAKEGFGNVPFHRTEFTAKAITAYFSIDLSQIRGYGLPGDATELLAVLSLWKVRKFLDSPMRLRTACELELVDGEKSISVNRPLGFSLPSASDLTARLTDLIVRCKPHFASPAVTELTWGAGRKEAAPAKKSGKRTSE